MTSLLSVRAVDHLAFAPGHVGDIFSLGLGSSGALQAYPNIYLRMGNAPILSAAASRRRRRAAAAAARAVVAAGQAGREEEEEEAGKHAEEDKDAEEEEELQDSVEAYDAVVSEPSAVSRFFTTVELGDATMQKKYWFVAIEYLAPTSAVLWFDDTCPADCSEHGVCGADPGGDPHRCLCEENYRVRARALFLFFSSPPAASSGPTFPPHVILLLPLPALASLFTPSLRRPGCSPVGSRWPPFSPVAPRRARRTAARTRPLPSPRTRAARRLFTDTPGS